MFMFIEYVKNILNIIYRVIQILICVEKDVKSQIETNVRIFTSKIKF